MDKDVLILRDENNQLKKAAHDYQDQIKRCAAVAELQQYQQLLSALHGPHEALSLALSPSPFCRMYTKMAMMESSLRRTSDGTAAQQLVSAELKMHDLEAEIESLARKNRHLADKLR